MREPRIREMRAILIALLAVFSMEVGMAESTEAQIDEALAAVFRGERPLGIPDNWVRSNTKAPGGFRWDDPANPGNSVRLFRGNPDDPNPSLRVPFVVEIQNGLVLDAQGIPTEDARIVAESLRHE